MGTRERLDSEDQGIMKSYADWVIVRSGFVRVESRPKGVARLSECSSYRVAPT